MLGKQVLNELIGHGIINIIGTNADFIIKYQKTLSPIKNVTKRDFYYQINMKKVTFI